MDLQERDVYIECLSRRIATNITSDAEKKAIVDECVAPKGTVQSIVRQLSIAKTDPSNCKCGFDNCECGKISSSGSKTIAIDANASGSKLTGGVAASQALGAKLTGGSAASQVSDVKLPVGSMGISPVHSTNELSNSSECSMMSIEANRLKEKCGEISNDEIRLLRKQNAELDSELQRYKCELSEMCKLMDEVEKQRESNSCLESEMAELQSCHCREVESLQSNYRATICDKDDELCILKKKLAEANDRCDDLELKMLECHEELDELRPYRSLREKCEELEAKLVLAEEDGAEVLKKSSELEEGCAQYQRDVCVLKKRIEELEIDLSEQRKYAKSLATQLQNRKQAPSAQGQSEENREFLIKCIKDIKKHYDALKKEKIERIQSYELRLMEVENENEALRSNLSNLDGKQESWNAQDCEDALVRKLAQFGVSSLCSEELIELHNQVRCAMLKIKSFTGTNQCESVVPADYYSKIADELRDKYKLSTILQWADNDEHPVKDTDVCSTKTMPASMQASCRKTSKSLKIKSRARSSEGDAKAEKCGKISRKSLK